MSARRSTVGDVAIEDDVRDADVLAALDGELQRLLVVVRNVDVREDGDDGVVGDFGLRQPPRYRRQNSLSYWLSQAASAMSAGHSSK
jgi:hypothetical protein